ncbi:hypothetical protein Tco_0373112 [Tanacetum coccineum]
MMKEEETEIPERRIEDVSVVRDFPDVFPKNLPRLPPTCQVEFYIELILGAATQLHEHPTRLSRLQKMKELSETERISKKRTKNEAKTTKPDTKWKSVKWKAHWDA